MVVRSPKPGQVVVRMEAAPINPSDLMTMLGPADLANAEFDDTARYPNVRIPVPGSARAALVARGAAALPVGQEGAGTVIMTAPDCADWRGRRVALMPRTGGTFGQYLTVSAGECVAVPDHIEATHAAALMVNPLTALAMVETVVRKGHRALINTAAASSLGQMLVKLCRQDNIALVNIVRREEHVRTLQALGAEYVCNSANRTFSEALVAAVAATGATAAFDAIGGGTMSADLLVAMEYAAAARMTHPTPYGSVEPKHVYIYGHLDPGPTLVHATGNGMLWGISGWTMAHALARLTPQRNAELRQRIIAESDTTFATTYARTVPLTQALTREAMLGYCRQATAGKYLISCQS